MTVLKGIDPALPPDLLHVLASMGHGDELCLADANFPAAAVAGAGRLVRLPGIDGPRALRAVLSLLPLDSFVEAPAAVMQVVGRPDEEPLVVGEYRQLLNSAENRPVKIEPVERFAFYERARQAFAVVATGEPRPYANILLRKGVIVAPCELAPCELAP